MHASRLLLAVTLGTATISLGVACGGGGGETGGGADAGYVLPDGTSGFTDDGGGIGFGDDATNNNGPDVSGPLAISPADDVIDVTYGQAPGPVQFTANINGIAVPASFSIDRGEMGSIVAATGVLLPSGAIGGTANVTAVFGGQSVKTTFTVHLHFTQNGAVGGALGDAGAGDAGDAGDNAGGNGGVGGEGVGGPVSQTTLGVLQATLDGGATVAADAGAGAAWLYPYDQTVWPRGLLAPLLQWSTPQSYDGVFIHLSEAGFDYQGFFASTASPFVHHPIPQAAWDALCNSNQGEKVAVTLVFSSGGQAYGPINESWTIAQGTLSGTVYYNSYGTNLAHLPTSVVKTLGGKAFGAATLAIKHNATSPVLVAGSDTECRVCHSVSADGSHLVTGNGDYSNGTGENPQSAWYDLVNGNAEHAMTPADGQFNWGALSPDGTLLFNNGAMNKGGIKLQGSAAEDNGPTAAQLFSVATGATFASTGIPAGLVAGSPTFSPDGKHVAFNFYSGTVGGTDAGAGDGGVDGGGALVGDGVSLAVMDYDPTASVFSNFRVVFTPPHGTSVWPTFLPTNGALVFELETQSNNRDWGGTRASCDNAGCASNSATGTKGELWWVDLKTNMAARLDGLNGLGYLPTMPATDHTADETLNYEPTVNPVPSGGYAWVVFTSRRLYGNIATIKPYWSDPRDVDISTTPTPKKLWVAAVDLSGTPGADASHPAFYLPAQELLAGNSRGYWVVDPCMQNGITCQTGDQCCGGYCEDTDGGFVCSAQPPACASLNDKCTTADQCCGGGVGSSTGTQCINGRCAEPTPPPPSGPR
ncbi:MAG TPA: hypothetical protein VH044_02640 [Polyangiaceae bacterium]|nr:hypothetical protein [Polyangiaceae bacterium]